MAVEEVYGKTNSTDILFTQSDGDVWTVSVPVTEDKVYVTEVTAVDTAGNIAYMCSMLFVALGHKLRAFIVPSGFSADFYMNEYKAGVSIMDLVAKIEVNCYEVTIKDCTHD